MLVCAALREINNSKLHETNQGCGRQRIPSHQGLMKVESMLMAMFFFLMSVLLLPAFSSFSNDVTRFKKSEPLLLK